MSKKTVVGISLQLDCPRVGPGRPSPDFAGPGPGPRLKKKIIKYIFKKNDKVHLKKKYILPKRVETTRLGYRTRTYSPNESKRLVWAHFARHRCLFPSHIRLNMSKFVN